jgi:hypothetical protein
LEFSAAVLPQPARKETEKLNNKIVKKLLIDLFQVNPYVPNIGQKVAHQFSREEK